MDCDQRPKIAVLLAAYNGMSWIKMQVDSILAQTDVKVDIFISVDLSDDGTYEWCESIAKQDKQIILLPYGKHFGGAAKNFYYLISEVNFSSYDFVSLADQDDIWLPNKLAHAIEVILKKNVQALSTDVTAFFQDGRELLIKKSYPQKIFDYFFESAGPGCTYVIRADALDQFKNFLLDNWLAANNVDYHDWLIYAYFRQNNLTWWISNQPLMRYRRHEFNQIGPNYGFRAFMMRLSLVRSKWYSKEVEKIFQLVDPIGASGLVLKRWFLIGHFHHLRRSPKGVFFLLFLLLTGIY